MPARGANLALDPLERAFDAPVAGERPWAWWFWIDGHISADGIRKDLTAMRDVGMSGINLFNVAPQVPPGPVRFMSPAWMQMMRLAGAEAHRLEFPFVMHNAAGWSGSGGPWVTPAESMQILVWSERVIAATDRAPHRLTAPPSLENYYRDIAVLAFPTPAAEQSPALPRARLSATLPGFDPAPLGDGDLATSVSLPREGDDLAITFDYPMPVTAASVRCTAGDLNRIESTWLTLEAASAGGGWLSVVRFDAGGLLTPLHQTVTATFEPRQAQRWRLRWERGTGTRHSTPIKLCEVTLAPAPRVHDYELRAGLIRRWGHDGGWRETPPSTYGAFAAAQAIDPEKIVDVTAHLQSDGRLAWHPPTPDHWTILRIGHTSNGHRLAPAPREGEGLEADKLAAPSPGLEGVFTRYVDRLLAADGADLRGKLHAIESDSWEYSTQTWTAGLREEFIRRRGYDPSRWLVVVAGGRIVGSPAQAERFLWDWRRTLADLLVENFYSLLRRRAHERGLLYYGELAGAQQFLYDPINALRQADVPMGEYWWDAGAPRPDCKLAASVAQLFDRRVVAAEAFTGRTHWREHPGNMKALADAGFVAGINQVIIHNFSHQPRDEPGPGTTLGPWGVNHNRLNTWWADGAAFNHYLARCSAVLQQGRFVGDVLYLLPEGAPSALSADHGPWRHAVPGVLPAGYDFTVTDVPALRERVRVADGRLTLPNGASYRVLVLPTKREMTPAAIRLIGDLVRAGAVVVGPKPLRSPSLEGWPRADAEVARLADEIWGDCDGIKVNQRRCGAGRVLWMPRLADALDACGVAPDVTWTGAPTDALDYIHRTADQTEVYFVTNRRAERIDVQISFRVTGLQPEWWDAETGVRAAAPIFVERDGRVEMPLRLAPHGSRFVVFRPRQARAPHYRSIANSAGPIAGLEVDHGGTYSLRRSDGAEVRVVVPEPPAPLKVDGPWQVTFQPSGDRPAFGVTFDSLVSWPLHRDERIRYFAGTATYRRDVEVPREFLQAGHRVRIDLGAVEVMARVCINDRDLGVAWKAPYQLEVSEALRPGRNRIEIKVTNLWINRLIGDEQAPADVEYRDSGELAALPTWWRDGQKRPSPRGSFVFWRHYRRDAPLVPSGLLGPVKLRATAALPPP